MSLFTYYPHSYIIQPKLSYNFRNQDLSIKGNKHSELQETPPQDGLLPSFLPGPSDPANERIQMELQNAPARKAELEKQKEEIRRLREELQYTQEKYRIVCNLSPSAHINLDAGGQILEANTEMAELLGINGPALTGANFSQYLSPPARSIFTRHIKEVLASGLRQNCEIQLIKSDHSAIPVRMESIAVRDSMGHLNQVLSILSDSRRKNYDELVRFQNTVFKTTRDAILATDRNLEITHWNKAAETIFGWESAEVIGKRASQQTRAMLLAPLSNDEVMKYLAENGCWTGETECCRKDGSHFKSMVCINILWDSQENFNGIIASYRELGSGQNSTVSPVEIEQIVKERTEELTKANRILQQELIIHKQAALLAKESEGKNRDLVDNIKLGIFRCTPGIRGKFLEVNKAMEEITGYSRDELLQIDVCDLYVNSDDEDHPFTNEVSITDWKVTRELHLKRKDGVLLTVAVTIVAIRFDSGETQYFDGILEDITERKQAQEQINQSLQRLQKTIKEIIQAMAYIGEVRDPYTAGHQRRVAQISQEICQILGLEAEKCEGLTMAAFVHDIGKILVPADILSKPGKLTKPEFDMLKDHTRIGYEILKTIEFPWPIATFVLQHHERIDGSGYPAGLSGEQIVIEAKILAVADVVEAMSSHRPYRPALGIEKALEEIGQNRGILYDAQVVDACIKLFREKGFNLN